jgi:hypothetical protein
MGAENYIQQNSNMFVHCKYDDIDDKKTLISVQKCLH